MYVGAPGARRGRITREVTLLMRSLMRLLVVAVMAALMVVALAAPAFAVGRAQCGIGSVESQTAQSLPPGGLGQGTSEFAQEANEQGINLGIAIKPITTNCAQG